MFYKIIEIALTENNLFLIVKEVIIESIDSHFNCHIISHIKDVYEMIPIDLFELKPFLSYMLSDGRKIFKLSNL